MNAIKQTAIKKYNKAIADLQRHRDAVDLLPDALVEMPGAFLYSTDGHLRVDLPMTPTAFRAARRLLGREWTRKGYEWQDETSGDRAFSFVHQATEVGLSLVLRVTAKGATCERRQVGVKEVAVYEVVCQSTPPDDAPEGDDPDAGSWGEYQHIKEQWGNRPEAS